MKRQGATERRYFHVKILRKRTRRLMQYQPLSRRPTRYRLQSEFTQADGVALPLLGKINDEFGYQQCERSFTIHQPQCAQRLFKRCTENFGILRRERVIALDNVMNG